VRSGRRGGPALSARVAAVVAGLTALLLATLSLAAFLSIRGALRGDLQEALRRDAEAIARAYDGGGGADARPGPTGRVHVQLYGPSGRLFAASEPVYAEPNAALPDSVVLDAPADWRGRLAGEAVQAAAAPFRSGTVVVLAGTAYIGEALEQVARSLAVVALALSAAVVPLAWFAARAATRPIRRLARAASGLDFDQLDPLDLVLPDDDVGQLGDVLDDLARRLRAARDVQRRFLADTSHELRSPLTSLRGFLVRAQRTAGADAESDLADADRIAVSMSNLVEDLLELSRGHLVRGFEPHLVDLAAEVLRPVAAEFMPVEFHGEGDATVLGEPERLRRLFRNLLANARRAAGPSGRLVVGWSVHGSEVVAWVEDDGPGLPPELKERLFEPFQRGPGGGTGLGLPIARQLVETHRGRIEAISEPGCTQFRITLPTVDVSSDDFGEEFDGDSGDEA